VEGREDLTQRPDDHSRAVIERLEVRRHRVSETGHGAEFDRVRRGPAFDGRRAVAFALADTGNRDDRSAGLGDRILDSRFERRDDG